MKCSLRKGKLHLQMNLKKGNIDFKKNIIYVNIPIILKQ